jgi:methyl coenzyme M reductase subunit C-like uncharacterized protein (methanogenesis marker protein 7)
MKATPLQHLALAIRNGQYDKKLDYVSEVIWRELKSRRQELAYDAALSLKVKDRVQVTGRIKPRYMIGCTGTIKEIVGMRVTIELDEPITRNTRTRTRVIPAIICMATSLEKIDE